MNRVFDESAQPGYRMNTTTYRILFFCLLLVSQLQVALGAAAAFPVYQFPEFSLSMTTEDIRGWAEAHEFSRTADSAAGRETWQRVFPNGYQQIIGFRPRASGLDELILTQINVTGGADSLARQVIYRYGEPLQTEKVADGSRLIYPYEYPVPARRVFTTGPYTLEMGLFTENRLTNLLKTELLNAEPRHTAATGSIGELPQWVKPMVVVPVGVLALVVLIALLPEHTGDPVRRWLRDLVEALLGWLGYSAVSIFTIILGVMIYPLFILSGCGAGVFALEQGTSWWWLLLWLAGVVYTIRSDEESGITSLLIANALFVAALFGPILELGVLGN